MGLQSEKIKIKNYQTNKNLQHQYVIHIYLEKLLTSWTISSKRGIWK